MFDSADSNIPDLNDASEFKVQFEVDPRATQMRDYVPPLHWTTMVPATTSYTVLLCWKKRSVMKTGKRKAMEKFLLSARTVDL